MVQRVVIASVRGRSSHQETAVKKCDDQVDPLGRGEAGTAENFARRWTFQGVLACLNARQSWCCRRERSAAESAMHSKLPFGHLEPKWKTARLSGDRATRPDRGEAIAKRGVGIIERARPRAT